MKVVVCSEVQWHYVRTRKQQILGRFPPDWPILFLQAYVKGRRNAWRPIRVGTVTYVTVPALKPVPAGILRWFLDRGVVRAAVNVILAIWIWIVRAATGFAGREVALYVSNIYYGRVLRYISRHCAVYDCNDNHLAFPLTPGWARGYLRHVVREVDAVVVSSSLLREEIEPLAPRAIVEIGNGVDFELFDAAYSNPRRPQEIASLPRPRIGYAGALAEWIDLELLAATARAFPEGTLVLVGPAVKPGVDPARFFAPVPNVRWLGSKPHEELPHYVAEMDVCLVPFRVTPLTRGVNPNKLWEYLSLGKPVVCTDFSPFVHAFAPQVAWAATTDGFIEAVRRALVAPGDESRRTLARHHSWSASAARMVRLFEDLSAGRPAEPSQSAAPVAAPVARL